LSYRIEYSPDVEDHLRVLTPRQQTIVFDEIDTQLKHRPTVVTKNRKPVRPNPLAPWELRIDALRVYYDVEEKPEKRVRILAVGLKRRNKMFVGKKEIEL
jgi:mRNA-degrading endonuclease RelE of RelBE toxin-antitoxin system